MHARQGADGAIEPDQLGISPGGWQGAEELLPDLAAEGA
jgi:hypothetical protein